jgi:4-amino-4-deoxychorismate lyase
MQGHSNYLLTELPSLKNRALNYGDGCFTTMMSAQGNIELLDLHVNRLLVDSKKLSIFNDDNAISFENLKILIQKVAKNAFRKSNSRCQIVKIIIARGDSERGYAPSADSWPIIIPSITDYDESGNEGVYRPSFHKPSGHIQGINIAVADMVLSTQVLLSGVKHLNRLEQVFAKMELAKCNGVDDLLLTESKGLMVELTSSNFFYHIDDIWHTPCLNGAGVNGVMRQFILNLLQIDGLAVQVSDLSALELGSIDAAFSCNAVTKVVPIASIKRGDIVYQLNTDLSVALAEKVSDEVQRITE